MIKILIADDQELIRQSLLIILDSMPDFQVTDTAADGQEVIKSVKKEKPDVILMDIRMPKMDGVICTQIIKDLYPDIKIIILTTFDDDMYVFNALKYGASGYLLKGISMKELSDAIRKVYQGTAMINEDIASKVVRLFSRMAQRSFQQGDRGQTQSIRGNCAEQPEQYTEQAGAAGQDTACYMGCTDRRTDQTL